MPKTAFSEFPVDNASILFLSLIRPYHTNSFRFSMELREPVCPEALQQAVDRITPRFPSVIAGLRQGFFHYKQVPAAAPPRVRPDPGILKPMEDQELRECCFRVYYKDCTVSIEAFHALTDGYGAITTFTTLIAEYLNLRHGLITPPSLTRLDPASEPQPEEVTDAFLDCADAPPQHLPSRFSYLPPRPEDADWQVRTSSLTMPVRPLLDAAHRYGVTLNTLLTTALAATVMEHQKKNHPGGRLKPVRIMVPADLRRLVGSRTLRNFSLYCLPTMEAEHHSLSFRELCAVFGDQLKQQLSKEALMAMVSYNVRTQNAWYFRYIPWKIKGAAMRLGYRFFGESNSSLTLTNLGVVRFPEELRPHIGNFQCCLTPRVSSPYGCTVMTYNDQVTLTMSRFCPEDGLGTLFFQKLRWILEE